MGRRWMVVVNTVLCVSLAAGSTPSLHAQVEPAAERTKALGIVLQVVNQLEQFVGNRQLGAVHNVDMALYSAITILLNDAGSALTGPGNDRRVALSEFGRFVADLHAAADAFDQPAAESKLTTVHESFGRLQTHYTAADWAAARLLSERHACPMHRDVVGRKGERCLRCGMEMDALDRISINSGAGLLPPQTIRARVVSSAPLTPGVPAQLFLRLAKLDNSAVTLDDLREVHTEKVHLLIVDTSLTDYHHEHPKPTRRAGEYSFTFTPSKPGTYRVWADLRSVETGFQEYVVADIPGTGDGEPLTDRAATLEADVDGLRYQLLFDAPPLKAGTPTRGRLRVTGAQGVPFTQLEPVMGSFAHLVGFGEDRTTVVHIHPEGTTLLRPTDRGGPELEFQFFTDQPGFIRFFAQVQIGGESRFVPFGLQVAK